MSLKIKSPIMKPSASISSLTVAALLLVAMAFTSTVKAQAKVVIVEVNFTQIC